MTSKNASKSARKSTGKAFTAEEQAAMKERARELKAEARPGSTRARCGPPASAWWRWARPSRNASAPCCERRWAELRRGGRPGPGCHITGETAPT